ncbi:hypothetical protein E4U53_003955 [Claviceps sorghi]|nr:hypothetical protein E4U53_003955 [Claviceps sorghi]
MEAREYANEPSHRPRDRDIAKRWNAPVEGGDAAKCDVIPETAADAEMKGLVLNEFKQMATGGQDAEESHGRVAVSNKM